MLLAGVLGAACAAPNSQFTPPSDDGQDGPPDAVAPADVLARDQAFDRPADAAPDRPGIPPGPDLRQGLLGHWKFDDGPGSAVARDSSGNGYDGVLENLDPNTAWTANGHSGAALVITTANDRGGVRVDVSGALDRLTAYTLAAWILRPASRPGAYESFISRQLGEADSEVFNLGVVNDRLRAYRSLQASGASGRAEAQAALPVGTWVHAAAVWDGQRLRLYQDGVEVSSTTHDFPLLATTKPLFLGTNQNANGDRDSLAGMLDDVLVYTIALSPQAIQSLATGATPDRL